MYCVVAALEHGRMFPVTHRVEGLAPVTHVVEDRRWKERSGRLEQLQRLGRHRANMGEMYFII